MAALPGGWGGCPRLCMRWRVPLRSSQPPGAWAGGARRALTRPRPCVRRLAAAAPGRATTAVRGGVGGSGTAPRHGCRKVPSPPAAPRPLTLAQQLLCYLAALPPALPLPHCSDVPAGCSLPGQKCAGGAGRQAHHRQRQVPVLRRAAGAGRVGAVCQSTRHVHHSWLRAACCAPAPASDAPALPCHPLPACLPAAGGRQVRRVDRRRLAQPRAPAGGADAGGGAAGGAGHAGAGARGRRPRGV